MYKWIDHIVVRVKDLEEGLRDYEGKLGLKRREDPKQLPELGMRQAVLPIGDDGRFIELCEPLGEGAIAGAMAKYGEGLHLVALAPLRHRLTPIVSTIDSGHQRPLSAPRIRITT